MLQFYLYKKIGWSKSKFLWPILLGLFLVLPLVRVASSSFLHACFYSYIANRLGDVLVSLAICLDAFVAFVLRPTQCISQVFLAAFHCLQYALMGSIECQLRRYLKPKKQPQI
jgi:hypothetical protein